MVFRSAFPAAQRPAYKPPPPRARYCTPQHQTRKQGNTRGPAPKAVGLIRLLCGLRMGQSQRTLPRVPATRTPPHKITHPQTRRCAHIDNKTPCFSATQNARATSRPAGDAPHNGWPLSRAAQRRRLQRRVSTPCITLGRMIKYSFELTRQTQSSEQSLMQAVEDTGVL